MTPTLPKHMFYGGFRVEVMCGSDDWWMVRYTEDSGEFTTKPFVVKTEALDREPEVVGAREN